MKTFDFPLSNYKLALRNYHNETSSILITNVQNGIDWFYRHYPKRTIKWVSGMGVNGFKIDDFWLAHADKKIRDKFPPLVRIEKEADDFEYSEHGHFIFTGDIGDPVADKMRLGILTPTY